MTHEAFQERLLDLAYGELATREARKVEEHAASCTACRAELARIRETRRTMSALADEPAPDRGERILLAAARERAERRRPRRALPPWLWGAAAAAFSFVVVAGVSYRLIAMRPGPLAGRDDEALLGSSPYATRAPEPAVPPERAAPEPTPMAEQRSGRAIAGAEGAEPLQDLAARAPSAASAPPEPHAKAAPARERFARAPEGDRAPAAKAPAGARAESAAPPVPDEPLVPERHAEIAAAEVPAADAELLHAPPTLDAPAAPSASAAPSRAEAPPAAASAAPSRAAAAPRARPAAAPDAALGRHAALRDSGALRTEVRKYAGCEGEAVRRLEFDPEGRLVRYVREGRIGGRRLRVEHVYGPDGRLASAVVRDLDAPGAALDADALGLVLPARANEAGLDAPPRCGR